MLLRKLHEMIDGKRVLLLGFGNTDFTHPLIVGDIAARLLDCFGSGFLTDGFDVTGFIGNIGYVYVDETKTDFLKLDFHVLGYCQ